MEDDSVLASFIIKGLKENGFAVDHSIDGEDGLHLALSENYDILVVDIMLPKKDGLAVIEKVRQQKPLVPILILSAKRSVEEKVHGLRVGSDDYMTKPFAFVELLARIHALLRRVTISGVNSYELRAGDLVLNKVSHEVRRKNTKINLKPKEFYILEYFMSHPGEVITRTMLMEHIWDFQFDPTTNIVDVHVCHLREKIDNNFEDKLIQTIRGVGYVFKHTEKI